MSLIQWSKATTQCGKTYYFNPKTNETSWEWYEWMAGSQPPPPPPPPPPQTELQEMEDFAKSCGWDGTCAKTHLPPVPPPECQVKYYSIEERPELYCCKYIRTNMGTGRVPSPWCSFYEHKIKQGQWYPCPSCDPDYWNRAYMIDSITEEDIREAYDRLPIFPAFKKQKASLGFPSPNEYHKIGNYTDATIILLNKDLNSLDKNFWELSDCHGDEINDIGERVHKIWSGAERFSKFTKGKIDTLEKKVDDMEKKIDNMEKIIKNNNEEIVNKYLDNITKEYGYEIDKHDEKIDNMEKKINNMEKIIKNMEKIIKNIEWKYGAKKVFR